MNYKKKYNKYKSKYLTLHNYMIDLQKGGTDVESIIDKRVSERADTEALDRTVVSKKEKEANKNKKLLERSLKYIINILKLKYKHPAIKNLKYKIEDGPVFKVRFHSKSGSNKSVIKSKKSVKFGVHEIKRLYDTVNSKKLDKNIEKLSITSNDVDVVVKNATDLLKQLKNKIQIKLESIQ